MMRPPPVGANCVPRARLGLARLVSRILAPSARPDTIASATKRPAISPSRIDHEDLQQELMINAPVGSSNEILTDQDESVPQEPTHVAYDILSPVDGKIPSLEARGEEYEWITRLRAGVSPQEQVPPEILGNIFKFCVDDDFSIVKVPFYSRTQGLMLSHICSRWRHVALVEPSLWNRVSVNYPSRVHPDALETILSRGGNSITFHLTMVHIPPPVLRVIHQYSDKFQSITLRFDYSRAVRRLDVPFSHVGALRKLRLEHVGTPTTFDVHHAISAFANPSCLRQLVAFELDAPETEVDLESPASLLIPWPQLEHLLIWCDMPFHKLVQILSRCAQLVSCDITFFLKEDEDTDSVTSSVTPSDSISFTLPNLRSITLQCSYGVLDSIVAPSLQELEIYHTPTTLETLLNFIRQSKCNLRTLQVSLPPTRSPDIEELLLAISGVTDLTILRPHVMSETTLESIATGALLPNVEVLECSVSSSRAVQQLILNRCKLGPGGVNKAIKKFIVRLSVRDDTSEWQELRVSMADYGHLVEFYV